MTPNNETFLNYSIFAKRIGLVGIAQTGSKFKGLVILAILAKTLGVTDYGIWSLILVSISLLQPILILGLDSSLLRFHSSENKKQIVEGLITGFIVVLVTGTIASILLFLFSDSLSVFLFKNHSAIKLIKISLPLLVLTSLNTLALGSFRIFGLIKRYAGVLLFQTFLEISLVGIIVFSGYGLIGALSALIISSIIILLLQLFLIFSYAGLVSPNFNKIKSYFKYGLPLVPTTIFAFVIASSDRYVIGYFMGAGSVGKYSAAYGLGTVILMFSSYLIYILRPTIYKLYDREKIEDVKKLLSHSTKYLLMISIPAAFGLSILSRQILLLVTTPEFVSISSFVIPLITFSTVLYGVELNFGTILRIYKKTKIFPLLSGMIALLNLGLNVLIVPYLGILGAAMTTLLSYFIMMVIMYHISKKFLVFDLNLKFITKCTIASIIMIMIIWLINPAGFLYTIITILIGIAVYFSILFLLKGLSKKEIKKLLSLVTIKDSIRKLKKD